MAVIDSSRSPEWRLKAHVVKRVRTFGDAVVRRVTIGTVQQVDYAVTSSLAADVAALQDDVAGIDGYLSVATSVQVVESTVTEAIDDLHALMEWLGADRLERVGHGLGRPSRAAGHPGNPRQDWPRARPDRKARPAQ